MHKHMHVCIGSRSCDMLTRTLKFAYIVLKYVVWYTCTNTCKHVLVKQLWQQNMSQSLHTLKLTNTYYIHLFQQSHTYNSQYNIHAQSKHVLYTHWFSTVTHYNSQYNIHAQIKNVLYTHWFSTVTHYNSQYNIHAQRYWVRSQ